MRLLKKLIVVVVILTAIPFIVAVFVKKDYAVEKEIVINKPKTEVFNFIRFLKNQDSFSKWANMDPTMKKTYRGADGTVGFVSVWESTQDDVGSGEQEIKKITEGEKIDYELRFIKPFESTEHAYMVTELINENQTKVKWGFIGKMEYPMNLMLLFIDFEKLLGDDFGLGLRNLKAILER